MLNKASNVVVRVRVGKTDLLSAGIVQTVALSVTVLLLAGVMLMKTQQLYLERQEAIWLMRQEVSRGGGNSLTTNTSRGSNMLESDKFLKSINGQYTLVMQGDSNLVLYGQGGVATWAAAKNPGVRSSDYPFQLILQPDGNLVVYGAKASKAIWASNTMAKGVAPYTLTVMDSGDVILHDSRLKALWSTNAGKNVATIHKQQGLRTLPR